MHNAAPVKSELRPQAIIHLCMHFLSKVSLSYSSSLSLSSERDGVIGNFLAFLPAPVTYYNSELLVLFRNDSLN